MPIEERTFQTGETDTIIRDSIDSQGIPFVQEREDGTSALFEIPINVVSEFVPGEFTETMIDFEGYCVETFGPGRHIVSYSPLDSLDNPVGVEQFRRDQVNKVFMDYYEIDGDDEFTLNGHMTPFLVIDIGDDKLSLFGTFRLIYPFSGESRAHEVTVKPGMLPVHSLIEDSEIHSKNQVVGHEDDKVYSIPAEVSQIVKPAHDGNEASVNGYFTSWVLRYMYARFLQSGTLDPTVSEGLALGISASPKIKELMEKAKKKRYLVGIQALFGLKALTDDIPRVLDKIASLTTILGNKGDFLASLFLLGNIRTPIGAKSIDQRGSPEDPYLLRLNI